jgi:hypothetical protein
MRHFNFQGASEYLANRHGLRYSPERLEAYSIDRHQSGLDWGPTPNRDGLYSVAALDSFADGIKRAKLTQVGAC